MGEKQKQQIRRYHEMRSEGDSPENHEYTVICWNAQGKPELQIAFDISPTSMAIKFREIVERSHANIVLITCVIHKGFITSVTDLIWSANE